ncbi:hypothetical protein D3C87_1294610 [compost metagenome]
MGRFSVTRTQVVPAGAEQAMACATSAAGTSVARESGSVARAACAAADTRRSMVVASVPPLDVSG